MKGSMENLVGLAKKIFFLSLEYLDREDLPAQLPQRIYPMNCARSCRATKEISAARIEDERKVWRPLPHLPAENPLRYPVGEGPWAHPRKQCAY